MRNVAEQLSSESAYYTPSHIAYEPNITADTCEYLILSSSMNASPKLFHDFFGMAYFDVHLKSEH